MSIVVAIKDKDTIYLGADSLTTVGDNSYNRTKCESNYKIMKLHKDILVGNVGQVAVKQCWHRNVNMFDACVEKGLSKEFLVKNVVPKIRRDMIDLGIIKENDKNPNHFVVANKDKLFVIDDDFGVFEVNQYIATGAGRQHSLSYLGDDSKNIRERILRAIESAAKFTNSVALPAVLINTKDLRYEVVEEVK